MKPNDLQRILMNTYKNGKFAQLKRGEDLRECDDLLFKFLYHELDDELILEARTRGIPAGQLAAERINIALSAMSFVEGHIVANDVAMVAFA